MSAANDLLSNDQHAIKSASLITRTKGIFEVDVNDQTLYSKHHAGRHAEPGEALHLFEDRHRIELNSTDSEKTIFLQTARIKWGVIEPWGFPRCRRAVVNDKRFWVAVNMHVTPEPAQCSPRVGECALPNVCRLSWSR